VAAPRMNGNPKTAHYAPVAKSLALSRFLIGSELGLSDAQFSGLFRSRAWKQPWRPDRQRKLHSYMREREVRALPTLQRAQIRSPPRMTLNSTTPIVRSRVALGGSFHGALPYTIGEFASAYRRPMLPRIELGNAAWETPKNLKAMSLSRRPLKWTVPSLGPRSTPL
jgi:hypothetical protein